MLQATDAGGSTVDTMSFKNDGTTDWSAPETPNWASGTVTKAWTLTSAGDTTKTVRVKVVDKAGNASEAFDTIVLDTAQGVLPALSIGAVFDIGIVKGANFTNDVNVKRFIGAPAGTTEMQVANDGSFSGRPWELFTAVKDWTIFAYPGRVVSRTVYMRYKDAAGNVQLSTFTDEIIMDVNAPDMTLADLGEGQIVGSGQVGAASLVRKIGVTATDDGSSPAQMQMRLSNRSDFAGANWKPYASQVNWDFNNGVTVYVEVRDGAGNEAPAKTLTISGPPPPPPNPQASCSPRPKVNVSLVTSAGALVATLSTTGANNGLKAVRFDSFVGAIVDAGDQLGQTAPFAISIPVGLEPTLVQFSVRRAPGAQSATVRLVVIDDCGEWSTLVGGGPSTWSP